MTEDELKLIEIFNATALSTSQSVLAEIQTIRLLQDGELSFDELMKQMQDLDKTLTDKAVQLLQLLKKHTGKASDELTSALKKNISDIIEDTIKQL